MSPLPYRDLLRVRRAQQSAELEHIAQIFGAGEARRRNDRRQPPLTGTSEWLAPRGR